MFDTLGERLQETLAEVRERHREGQPVKEVVKEVEVKVADGHIHVTAIDSERVTRAYQGTTRALLANMIVGVDLNPGRRAIAEKFGKSRSYVYGRLKLLEATKVQFSPVFMIARRRAKKMKTTSNTRRSDQFTIPKKDSSEISVTKIHPVGSVV